MLTTCLNLRIHREGVLHIEAVCGGLLIRSIAVKWSYFGKFRIFSEFPFFVAPAHLVIQYLGKFPAFEHFLRSWLRRRRTPKID